MEEREGYFAIWRYATDDEIDAVLAVAWEEHIDPETGRRTAAQAYDALYKGETCCPWGVVSDRLTGYRHLFKPDPSASEVMVMLEARLPDAPDELVGEAWYDWYDAQAEDVTGEARRFIDGWDAGAFTLDEFRLALLRIKRARAQGG